jgi:stage II sporulation protein D
MRRIALLTALLALACAPAAADAKTRFWIKGAGFGHGIGMSQYGAQGMAKIGRNYQQILAHYYRHTVVSLTPTRSIRVLLQSGVSRASFSGATKVGSKTLDMNRTYYVRQHGAGVRIRTSSGKRVATYSQPVKVTSSLGYVRLNGTALNGVTSGHYRGGLELRGGGGVTVVNALGLDAYVRGVVPGEMPPSWYPEALKAQAVAARTYALASDRGSFFDVYPDTRSQMYKGKDYEVASTNAATRDTRRDVVTYNGQIITTFFFSTSGGKTESIQNVFYGATPEPYLHGVKDPYDKGAPRHRWKFGPYTRAQISAKLGSLCRGSFRKLRVVKHGYSPRIVRAKVVCSRGTVTTNGVTLRSVLHGYDSWIRIVKVTSGSSKKAAATALRKRIFAGGLFSPGLP